MKKLFILKFIVLFFYIFLNGENDFLKLRKDMVEDQIKARGVKDEKVLKAMLKVERHKFVSENLQKYAYNDLKNALAFFSGKEKIYKKVYKQIRILRVYLFLKLKNR